MFKNVLAPYDGTAFSKDGLLRALRIASLSNARLHLVHVDYTPLVSVGDDRAAADTRSGARQVTLNELYAIANECRTHSRIDVSAAVEIGPVADALTGYARRNDVDLIVLASHGRGGIARAWLGSVADRLIRETGLPVLISRSPSIATAAMSPAECRQILVPLDGSSLAEQSIMAAVLLAQAEHAEITLLRIVPEETEMKSGVLQSARGRAPAHVVQAAERYLDQVAARFVDSGVAIATSVMISSDVAGAILYFAEYGEFDAIAMATHGRGGLARLVYGSVADRVVRGSLISTLVIHPTAREAKPVTVRAGAQLLSSPIFSANAT